MAVFGCGGVGLNVIQGARLLNASRIIAVDVIGHKLEFAYKFGATDVVNARETDPVEAIQDMTDGGVDYAFDSFGNPNVIAQALGSIRKAGTAVLIGLPALGDEAPVDMVDMVRNQKRLVGSFYGSAPPHETFRLLLDFYNRGKIDVDSVVTRRYGLDQINERLRRPGPRRRRPRRHRLRRLRLAHLPRRRDPNIVIVMKIDPRANGNPSAAPPP